MALIEKLTAIANAIRSKTGKSATLTLDEMPTEIASIETGSGGGTEDLNDVLAEQETLIAELKSTLQGKASGGENLEETSLFDPTKETILKRSTASYKDIFLTKTIMAYVNTGKYAGYLGCKFDATVGKTYKLSWDKLSSSQESVFVHESDTILTKVDDNYGLRLYEEDTPYIFTATKPYVYIWLGHPSAPSTAELVLVTGLMVHEVKE